MKKSILFISMSFGWALALNAQWNSDPSQNNPLSTVATSGSSATKINTIAAPDGSGGMFIAWEDNRNSATSGTDIYLQHINNDGTLQFANGGLAVCTATGSQGNTYIVSDGAGGVILAWQDPRNSSTGDDIYAQRIVAAGTPSWGDNGILISNGANTNTIQSAPLIALINSTEAVIAWRDSRGTSSDPYANKILLTTGATQWTDVQLSNAAGTQTNYDIVADGANGVIIVWEDPTGTPSAGTADRDLFGQRLNNNGDKQWSVPSAIGHSLIALGGIQQTPKIAADGVGGFVAVWADQRSGTNGGGDIFAQRFNNSGSKVWANDVQLVSAAGFQSNPNVVNSAGEFVFEWSDPRAATSNRDIYTQKLDANGAAQWTPTSGTILDAIPIVTLTGHQPASSTSSGHLLLSDNAGGAFYVWDDARSPGTTASPDMYAQKISTTGAVLWAENGAVVSNATNGQRTPAAVRDGAGGIIVGWNDSRSGGGFNEIYASRVFSGGVLPIEFFSIKASQRQNIIAVQWSATCDNNTDKYVVEKSADGRVFSAIGVVKAATVALRCNLDFTFDDKVILNGNNYYRIKGVDKDGSFKYSPIARITTSTKPVRVMGIYPNPALSVANLQLSNFETGRYTARIINSNGAVVDNRSIMLDAAFTQVSLPVERLAKGSYMVVLVDENGKVAISKQLLKQ